MLRRTRVENRRIFLVDFSSSGHHRVYMQVFCQILLSMGHGVVAVYADVAGLSAWANEALSGSERERLKVQGIEIKHWRGLRSERFRVFKR